MANLKFNTRTNYENYEVPFDFPSESIGCRLTKYFILVQREVKDEEINAEYKGHTNPAFENTGDTYSKDNHTDGINEKDSKTVQIQTLQATNTNISVISCENESTDGKTIEDDGIQPEDNDSANVSDGYHANSLTSSSSALPKSVSSGSPSQQKVSSKCELCGAHKHDSGYLGQYSSDNVAWMTSYSSNTNSEENCDGSWRIPLEQFTSKRQGSKRKHKSVPRPIRSFYKSQDDLINQYEDVRLEIDDAMENAEEINKLRKTASLFAKWTFFVNFCLLIIKVVAVALSGSISLISSLVDSSVDLLSGLVIWITTRLVKRTDRYMYPQGRTKLEPMAIVILSVIMSAASLQIVKESVTKLIGLSNQSQNPPLMDFITIGISCVTVVAKLVLFFLCRRVPHPTVQALAQDHKNDVIFNSAAIVFGYIGSQQMQDISNLRGLIYVDPVGALVLCVYIIASWCSTGWEQIKLLIGHTASPEFLSKITWMAVDHHKKIQQVDTVRAFHFGNHFLVEVDIVLPPEMTLREAHDISEPLQQKIEKLPNVERAFVHVDYETTHDPATEHKRV